MALARCISALDKLKIEGVIASPPFENELVFATRMRDTAFKRSLREMPLGTEVKIDPAMGSFTLRKNSAKPAMFLAGGIGITPFLSIARQAARMIDGTPKVQTVEAVTSTFHNVAVAV